MTDMLVKDNKLAFVDSSGEGIYFLPRTASTDANKIVEFTDPPVRLGSNQITKNLSLSAGQSALFTADALTIPSGVAVTLDDSANLFVISPDVFESLFKYKRDGEIVQTQTYRIDGFGTYFYFDAHYSGWPGEPMTIFNTKFKPRYSTSKIIIEYNILGAASTGNCGVRISKDGSVISTSGYEGYNAPANLDVTTSAAGNYRYATYARLIKAADDGAPLHHSFTYCDKPATTNEITYGLLLHATTNADVTFTFNKDNGAPHANGDAVGVSTIKISEIYETS